LGSDEGQDAAEREDVQLKTERGVHVFVVVVLIDWDYTLVHLVPQVVDRVEPEVQRQVKDSKENDQWRPEVRVFNPEVQDRDETSEDHQGIY